MNNDYDQNLRLECLKIASSIHANSAEMTIAAANKIYDWLIAKSKQPEQKTEQINS